LTQTLFDAAEAIRLAAVLLTPIMPASSAEILRRVGASADSLHLDRDGRWRNAGERVLKQEGPLWPRVDTSGDRPAPSIAADRRVGPTKELATVADNAPPPPQPAPAPTAAPSPPSAASSDRIAIDDFMK